MMVPDSWLIQKPNRRRGAVLASMAVATLLPISDSLSIVIRNATASEMMITVIAARNRRN